MDGAAHVARPDIEIPAGADVQCVPAGANQRRGAIVIVLQEEFAAMQGDVAVSFGIPRLLGDVESEFFVRNEFGDAFLDDDAVAENALAISADEVPAVR